MIIIEGSDAVGKTSTVERLKEENIVCLDRSKEMFSKYMLFEYSLEYRAKKYNEYLKNNDVKVIFLVNNDKEELERRVKSRKIIDEFDLKAYEYNKLYKETFDYMKVNNMLEDKLFLVDVTNLNLDEQVKKVRDLIICLV